MKLKKRLHFGVLFSSVDNASQCRIWEGIVDFAQKHDIHLTAYLGTYQAQDEAFDSHYETCFEAIKKAPLDGLIMFSGFIAEDMGVKKFKKHIKELPKTLPLVSISFPIDDVPSVLVDNERGIYDVVEHLIKQHSKNKIVFVKGPDGHPEAEERFRGYKKALKDNGIEYREKYVLKGKFSRDSGQRAMVELLDELKIPFDAVVACDDETAIGAMRELLTRKILVPTNVAVAGFDNDLIGETHIPSLTTSRQPFFEIGNVAASTLFDRIAGEIVPELCLIKSEFIARQSCGCLEEAILLSLSKKTEFATTYFIYPFVLQKISAIFKGVIPATQVHAWTTALVEKITQKPFSRKEFLHLFDEILIAYRHNLLSSSPDFAIWHKVVGVLFDGVEQHKNEVDDVEFIFSALNSASTLIHNINSKEDKCRELNLGMAQWFARKSTNNLVLTFDFDALSEKLRNLLPELSIDMAVIGLYKEPILSGTAADRTIDKVIGFYDDKIIKIKNTADKPITFENYFSVMEDNFEQKLRMLFFVPLFFNDEELGIMILPYSSSNPDILYWNRRPFDMYEMLRVNISTAVKGAELLTKVQTLSITDELTGLLNRRGFFQFAYARLPYLSRHSEISAIVLFMDMDGLKHINDTYGHKEGDAAIAVCAKLLREVLRDEDIIGRIGGDEFVAFSSVKTAENSKDVIRRIQKKFDEYNAQKIHPYPVSCSAGAVVLKKNATREDFDAAIQSADNVLYEEKIEKKGKGLSR